jgi:6-phosphogluconolactonase (cycloisomerase 2 family)
MARTNDGEIVTYRRDAETGKLSLDHKRKVVQWGPSKSAISPDGPHVYVLEYPVPVYSRDAESGRLEFIGPTVDVACKRIAFSCDGQFVYGVDGAVSCYQRDAASGLITMQQLLIDERYPQYPGSTPSKTGIAYDVAVSRDGKRVYVPESQDQTLVVFRVDGS